MSYPDSRNRYIALYTIVWAALMGIAIDSSFGHKISALQSVGVALIIIPGLVFDIISMCF